MEKTSLRRIFLALLVGFALAGSGCATKKYVRTQIDPINQRVAALDTRTQEQGQEIDELGTKLSRVDEKAMTADQRAQTADGKAELAKADAARAGETATTARSLAESAKTEVGEVGKRIDALHKYELASEATVLFAFESEQLSDEAKQKLDELASKIPAKGPYAVEIMGFTDTTGGRDYNLALSEKRASAVVRYLTLKHNVPLHRVYRVGLGSENPAEENSTRDGRRMNRRVEVSVYTADQPALSARKPD